MKNLELLTPAAAEIRTHQANATRAEALLQKELATFTATLEAVGIDLNTVDTNTKKEIKQKETEIRDKHTPAILKARQEILKIRDNLLPAKPAWEDSLHVLSTRPVSERSPSNFLRPKDPHVEAMARMSLSSELKNVGTSQLPMMFDDAIGNGQEGRAYLIALESNARNGQPGHTPLDIGKVVLKDRSQALRIFAEAEAVAYSMEIMSTAALSGKRTPPADVLALGHLLETVERYNTI